MAYAGPGGYLGSTASPMPFHEARFAWQSARLRPSWAGHRFASVTDPTGLQSVNDRFVRRSGSDHPTNGPIQDSLLDRERSGHGGSHRDFDRDDDALAGGLDDPAETTQRDVALSGLRVAGAVDREQDVLEELLDIAVVPF